MINAGLCVRLGCYQTDFNHNYDLRFVDRSKAVTTSLTITTVIGLIILLYRIILAVGNRYCYPDKFSGAQFIIYLILTPFFMYPYNRSTEHNDKVTNLTYKRMFTHNFLKL